MPGLSPMLDERTFRDLVAQLFREASDAFKNAPSRVGVWKPPQEGWTKAALVNPDGGTVLAGMFARLLEIALQRLNRVPEKNLLAFLDLLGVNLLPPAPARGPITLTPAPGITSAFVPRGLQVAAADGVTFETDRDVTVVDSQMVEAWTIDPVWDRQADYTEEVTQPSPRVWKAFEGNRPLPHALYFTHADLLNFYQATHVQLRFPIQGSGLAENQVNFLSTAVRWWYWHEGQARLLRATADVEGAQTARKAFIELEDDELASRREQQKTRAPITGTMVERPTGTTRPAPGTTVVTGITAKPSTTGAVVAIPPTAGTSTHELGTVTYSTLEATFGVKLPKYVLTLDELATYSFVPPPLLATERFRVLGVDLLQLAGVGLSQPLDTRWIWAELLEPLPGNELANALHMKTVEMTVSSDQVHPDHVVTNGTLVEPGKHFQPFGPRPAAGDTLYLGSEEVFSKSGSEVEVAFGYEPVLHWQYWDGQAWRDLELTGDAEGDARNFTRTGTVSFKLRADMRNAPAGVTSVPEKDKAWLRVDLFRGNYLRPPVIVMSAFSSGSQLATFSFWGWEIPLANFSSYKKLRVTTYVNEEKVDDPSQPFFALGAQPGPKTYLYIGLELPTDQAELANITDIVLSVGSPRPTARLVWEYGTADGWVPMGVIDNTDEFTHGGTVQFVCPTAGIERRLVAGRVSRWVRARLIAGDYGKDAEYIPTDPNDTAKGFKLRIGTGRVNAPTIYSMWIKYKVRDSAQVVRQTGAILELLSSSDTDAFRAFLPAGASELGPLADEHPALYLGFDTPFDNVPATFYNVAAAREFTGGALRARAPALIDDRIVANLVVPGASPRWQYWNGQLWKDLAVMDETAGLAESGRIVYIGPKDPAKLTRFNRAEAYWLRVQWPAPADDLPSIAGIHLNTIPAIQATTVRDELVGSSTGQPSQTFRLLQVPVLPGQQVWVHEPEVPSEEERAAIEREEGLGAIDVRVDPVTDLTEAWVHWHEVSTLDASSPRDRHYTLDHATGELRFGDGTRGLIPPRGVDNIQAREYRSGGGSAGNVPAGAIQKLKNPPATLAKAINPQAFDGGGDLETVTGVTERGPYTLKHRDRAVSPEDFEWLARQASGTRVARAKCLPHLNWQLQPDPGWTTVLVVPQGEAPRLTPGAELIREVGDYLKTRAFAGLVGVSPEHINVIGPAYLQVTVQAQIVPTDMAIAELVRQRVIRALDGFFHSLRGGPKGAGWFFGRNVYASEVAALLEGVDGVHHVQGLALVPNMLADQLTFESPVVPIEAVPEGSFVVSENRSFSALLAEPLQKGVPARALVVKGLKEGDRITLAFDVIVRSGVQGDPSDELPVRAPDGVQPVTLPVTFPRNSLVMSEDGRVLTRLARPLLAGREVSGLHLATDLAAFGIGDRLTVLYPFQTVIRQVGHVTETTVALAIDPWMVDAPVTTDSQLRIATLDNSVRAPLAADLEPGEVTEVACRTFASGTNVLVLSPEHAVATTAAQVQSRAARVDLVYVEDNYLIYPGAHEVTMVGETGLGSA